MLVNIILFLIVNEIKYDLGNHYIYSLPLCTV